MVFDESYRRMGSVASRREHFQEMWGGPVGYAPIHKIYEWSTDNQKEIDQGWVFQAGTLAELARKIGGEAPAIEETVRNFNRACIEGRDSQFGRPGKSLAPLETPPYYAIELALTLINTQGGPKHNKDCKRWISETDQSRDCTRGRAGFVLWFPLSGRSNYPEAWAFGRIAGERRQPKRLGASSGKLTILFEEKIKKNPRRMGQGKRRSGNEPVYEPIYRVVR